jgi:hypothetical protein
MTGGFFPTSLHGISYCLIIAPVRAGTLSYTLMSTNPSLFRWGMCSSVISSFSRGENPLAWI